VGEEEPGVQEEGSKSPPPAKRAAQNEDQSDDQHVRAGEGREEGGDETPDRIVLVSGVVDPVLGETREALVVEPELLAVPPGHT
jgi:hypothetical protein